MAKIAIAKKTVAVFGESVFSDTAQGDCHIFEMLLEAQLCYNT